MHVRPASTAALLGPLLGFALALPACTAPNPSDDDDSAAGDDDDALPDQIPVDWISETAGTVENLMQYQSGTLQDTECTEVFDVAGTDVTDINPDQCAQCEIVFDIFITQQEATDCPGRDDLAEQGKLGFDLRQDAEEAVAWWFVEGWFGSEWTELGTGTLVRDDAGLKFDFSYSFDDPDNGSWTGNWTIDDPCSWGEPCSWNGYYTISLGIPFEVAAE